MNKLVKQAVLSLLATTALAVAAPAAFAGGHSNVNWSINVGTGYPVAQVYSPPPAVVYVQPQPVYVQPAAVVTYAQPYYVQPYHGKKQWKHHHHHGHGYGY